MASPRCCTNPPPPPAPAAAGGYVVDDFGGFKAYLAGSPDSKLAVLLVPDVYGYEAPNFRKIADKVAASGFFVVAPDLFCGDPYSPEFPETPLSVWLLSHTPDKGYEYVKTVIAALKGKGVSAIGAAGFCWGAKVVIELAKSAKIQAAVLLHPSFVTVEDTKEAKCHVAVLGAETDHFSPPALVRQYEEVLSSKSGIDSFVKIFPGVAHGWAVKYKLDDEAAMKSAEEAHQDMLNWRSR